jgi:hypothetical protein
LDDVIGVGSTRAIPKEYIESIQIRAIEERFESVTLLCLCGAIERRNAQQSTQTGHEQNS